MYKINDSLMEKQQKNKKSDFAFIIFVLILLLVISIVTTFGSNLIKSVYVSGSSMYPTLQNKDVLFMDYGAKSKCGDIIVIDGEKKNMITGEYEWLIKRQIAIGDEDGTVVEIKDGRIFIDNVLLEENYLSTGVQTNPDPVLHKTRWELEEGEIFFLGDNRAGSLDSRSSYDTCKQEQVVGVVSEWAVSHRWLSRALFDVGQFFRKLF